ncbi:VTT domain-containing protein [Variovorax terrae]|uniref:VTT domain-containing protein n=1 Tax=Variovorax terrae TaxID=2923278 RepID=A0A9X1VWS9_9BURK|nr:VTT domain-containing protein [Variovorax terrae]MCJ0764862.1 VTT domain-containing protein [Variovorax terrae]
MPDIPQILQYLRHDAVTVVFLNVLLQQIGLPVPAVPTLLLAGSLALSAGSLGPVLVAAILASVLADGLWYGAGRHFGYRVLAGLCRLSINPGSCVSETEARFVRWGVSSLVVAKFVPGFSTVAPPIAGALRMRLPGFLAATAFGAGLWAGAALVAGWLLRDAVTSIIAALDAYSGRVLLAVLLLVALWLGWKLWQKYRFRRLGAVPHITPVELIAALAAEDPAPRPLLLDLRSAVMIAETGPVAGARAASIDELPQAVRDWPRELPIVTMCACPEDATAIQAAHRLREAGYLSVRPLRGGYHAWMAANAAPAQAVQQS